MAERVYLTVAEVIAIHHHQIEEYGGSHGVRDQGALETAVFRPQTGYYNDLSEEAAALPESLVNNHAFVDGNKWVGFARYAHVPAHQRLRSELYQQRRFRVHDQDDGGWQVPLCIAPSVDCRAHRSASSLGRLPISERYSQHFR